MKNYDKYGLGQAGSNAGDVTSVKAFVLLVRQQLLEEVAKYGFMCDWNDFKVHTATACWNQQALFMFSCTLKQKISLLPAQAILKQA